MHKEISDDKLQKILSFNLIYSNLEITVINAQNTDFDYCKVSERWDSEAGYFLGAGYYLPNNVDRCFVFDIDVICNGNLNEIYDTDFDNNSLIAFTCREFGYKWHNQKLNSETFEQIEIARRGGFFNVGILLMNIEKMRELKITLDYYRKTVELFNSLPEYSLAFLEKPIHFLGDQAVANMQFLNDHKLILTHKIISQTAFRQDCFCYSKQCILIHYHGLEKPWNKRGIEIANGTFELNNAVDKNGNRISGNNPDIRYMFSIYRNYLRLSN